MKFGHFINFLSKTRIISQQNQNLLPFHTRPCATHHTLSLLSTPAPPPAVLWEEALQPGTAYCGHCRVDRHSTAFSKMHAGLRCQEGTCHQVQWELLELNVRCPRPSHTSVRCSRSGSRWAGHPSPGQVCWTGVCCVCALSPHEATRPICDAALRF